MSVLQGLRTLLERTKTDGAWKLRGDGYEMEPGSERLGAWNAMIGEMEACGKWISKQLGA